MDDLSKMTLAECKDSKFIRPLRLNYRHAGKDKVWDVVLCHSSVYIIIYNASKKKMVFVKQFRPAVYFSHIRRDKVVVAIQFLSIKLCYQAFGLHII